MYFVDNFDGQESFLKPMIEIFIAYFYAERGKIFKHSRAAV